MAKPKKKPLVPVWPLYVILIVAIIAYIFYNNIIIGAIAFVVLILALLLDVKASVDTGGMKGAIKDIAMAVGAVIVLWIILIVILGTSSPVDVVASCSMLPTLQRGDMVVLHGISNFTDFTESSHIPVVNMTPQQFSELQSSMYDEFLAYYAYYPQNASDIADIVSKTAGNYSISLYNTKCISDYDFEGEYNRYNSCRASGEAGNLIQYNYSVGNVTVNGEVYNTIYTSSIRILNTTIYQNYSNPIMVYRTTSSDSFSGDIIHRAYAAIRVGDNYSILTQGDNNQYLDIEAANYIPNQTSIIGYEVARIPYIGYIKLILTGQIGTVAGCNMQMQRP